MRTSTPGFVPGFLFFSELGMKYKYLLIDVDGNVYGVNSKAKAKAALDEDDDSILVDLEAGSYEFAGETRDVEELGS